VPSEQGTSGQHKEDDVSTYPWACNTHRTVCSRNRNLP